MVTLKQNAVRADKENERQEGLPVRRCRISIEATVRAEKVPKLKINIEYEYNACTDVNVQVFVPKLPANGARRASPLRCRISAADRAKGDKNK